MKVCITGAAGNLGGLILEYLLDTTDLHLNLLIHSHNVSQKIAQSPQVSLFKGDLNNSASLDRCLENVDVVIHFAGVLFKANPEKFLPRTNTIYFQNLCKAAVRQNVRRIILISFPHVEGETTPDNPAVGRLDGTPDSAHAQTRLEEEKYLLQKMENESIEKVVLRVGMVYGRGILMIDAARWFSKYNLLGIWKDKTWIHLISKDDFLEASKNAIINSEISGIYHIGDDGRQTLQEFLDIATSVWGYKKPWKMPLWIINSAASFLEIQSFLFNTRSPLTRDFIKIGRVSYYGDTSRMKQDLLLTLKYPDISSGKNIL